jgi:hypothetical protein
MKRAPWLVKGLSLQDRMHKMQRLLEYDIFFETDFSRMDMTISTIILLIEHDYYAYMFTIDEWAEVKGLLQRQLKTNVYHALGLFYRIVGQRLSGDANTSIGNAIINRGVILMVMKTLDVTDFVAFAEGDDGAGGIRTQLPFAVIEAGFTQVGLEFGFGLKVKLSRSINDINFCGRQLYEDHGLLCSMCDVPRSLMKFHITAERSTSNDSELKGLLVAKAEAYNATDGDTPIVGNLCRLALRTVDAIAVRDKTLKARKLLGEYRPGMTNASICSVSEQLGVSTSYVKAYCEMLDSLNHWPSALPLIPNEMVIPDSCTLMH